MGLISQFIPTVGTYLAIALPALIAILSDEPLDAVWVIIFATVYQQIENYFFAPKISAKTMDIHPAVAFGSVIAGAALFGPIGALIGIPVAAAVLAFLQAYTRRYELIPELANQEK
jgi:predicted PurR-regulated permease PerM